MFALIGYLALLLIVMPGLLLGVGLVVSAMTKKRPGFITFPVDRETLRAEREAEQLATKDDRP